MQFPSEIEVSSKHKNVQTKGLPSLHTFPITTTNSIKTQTFYRIEDVSACQMLQRM